MRSQLSWIAPRNEGQQDSDRVREREELLSQQLVATDEYGDRLRSILRNRGATMSGPSHSTGG